MVSGAHNAQEVKPFEAEGRAAYNRYVDSLDIHCNRMPGWRELTEQERSKWRAEAAADAPATPEFIERMRKGHSL